MTQPPNVGPALMQMFADVVHSDTPLIPEMAVSDLLGVVWSGVEGSRAEGVDFFCRSAAEQLRPYGGKARPMLEVLARQAPGDAAAAIRQQADGTLGVVPGWVPMLDAVELLDATVSSDVAGLQENFILHFGYRDGSDVVGRHVIIALVDHPLGIVKDAFLVNPDVEFATIRATFARERELIVRDLNSPHVTESLLPAMRRTEEFGQPEVFGEELEQVWHLLKSRVRVLLNASAAPVPNGTERSRIVTRFLSLMGTKQVMQEHGLDRGASRRMARAIVDYQYDVADGSWTPEVVEAFFMDWAIGQDWAGNDQALVDLAMEYMFWTLKGTDYAPVTMAVGRWGAEFVNS